MGTRAAWSDTFSKPPEGNNDGLVETLNIRSRVWWVPLVGIALVCAAAWQWWAWNRGLAMRRNGMLVCWLAFVALWFGLWVLENPVMENVGTPTLLLHRHYQCATGIEHPTIVTYGYLDTNIPFYTHTDAPVEEEMPDLQKLAADRPPDLIIVADPVDWKNLEEKRPWILVARFELVTKFPQYAIGAQRWIMRPKPATP